MENSSSGVGASLGAAGESATIPQSTDKQTTSNGSSDSSQVNSPNIPKVEDEPEWELEDGKKYKRSVALKRMKDLEKGMYKSHEKAAETSKKYDAVHKTLSKFGVSVEEFLANPDEHFTKAAQQLISRQVEESLMDPRELQYKKDREEIEREKEEIRKFNEQRQAEEAESRTAERVNQIANDLVPALKASGLPANAKTVARVADVMMGALQKGVMVDPAEAANYAKKLIEQEQGWYLQQRQSAEDLVAVLDPKQLEALRRHFLEQARPKQPQVAQPRQQAPEQSSNVRRSPYIGWDEYRNNKRI